MNASTLTLPGAATCATVDGAVQEYRSGRTCGCMPLHGTLQGTVQARAMDRGCMGATRQCGRASGTVAPAQLYSLLGRALLTSLRPRLTK